MVVGRRIVGRRIVGRRIDSLRGIGRRWGIASRCAIRWRLCVAARLGSRISNSGSRSVALAVVVDLRIGAVGFGAENHLSDGKA